MDSAVIVQVGEALGRFVKQDRGKITIVDLATGRLHVSRSGCEFVGSAGAVRPFRVELEIVSRSFDDLGAGMRRERGEISRHAIEEVEASSEMEARGLAMWRAWRGNNDVTGVTVTAVAEI